jgi:hypothetical protein
MLSRVMGTSPEVSGQSGCWTVDGGWGLRSGSVNCPSTSPRILARPKAWPARIWENKLSALKATPRVGVKD